ncbi:MAG: YidC/Oxa1 family membrane protein insertase [Mycoplasmatales bacterium]
MKSKRLKLILLMIPLTLALTGCGAQISTEASGFWNWLVIIFAKCIVFFGEIFGNSLGWGLIIMTLIIRFAMIPLYGKQIKSSEQMKLIQPKINALNKKYEGKKDQDSQRKKAMEQQAIYKEAGINPLAGCLPMLLQLPLLFAFYDAIQYLVPAQATVEQLKEQGKTVIYGLEQLNSSIDVSDKFLGIFDLSNPVIIFAILAAATTYLTTYVSMIGQAKDAPGAGMMKNMMIIMPLMILVFGITLPGALSIYWCVGNIVSVGQTLYFKRSTLQTYRQQKNFKAKK